MLCSTRPAPLRHLETYGFADDAVSDAVLWAEERRALDPDDNRSWLGWPDSVIFMGPTAPFAYLPTLPDECQSFAWNELKPEYLVPAGVRGRRRRRT
ncbi:hypothetical protein DL766_001366 [Monosporascus sp. MC13-8B]|uniref:Alpha/beta hydrolase fold-3 domain-containing protein n=1 Tax=Monosporascus cannonballus TaxID=155416 RepID=A0ABY0HLG5_9PEZI|nr:hypothetical protein DL763_005004 [Monosporascus cannonballus]RYO93246.1 hypothetical protein DL762_001195 [Monosporascus cannonballus]RYP37717.1 hypothetical protein DL766_001366 [Monosporascus sp. MC13-8B]